MESLTLRAVLAELAGRRGEPLRSVAARNAWEIHLSLGAGTVVVCAHPAHNALFAIDAPGEAPEFSLPFAAALERALAGARFAGAVQFGLDRVAALSFERRDRLGDVDRMHLVAELTGRGANLLLVGGEDPWTGTLVDLLRAVPSTRRGPMAPGRAYSLPPSAKPDLLRAPPEALVAALASAGTEPTTRDLVSAWQGMSPVTAAEVLARAGGERGPETLAAVAKALVLESARTFWVAGAGESRQALVFRPGAPSPEDTSHAGASAAVSSWHEWAAQQAGSSSRHPELDRALRQALRRVERALAALVVEAAESARGEEERRVGEAILAAAHTLRRGLGRVEVPDPRTGEPMVVELDPALSPSENAEVRFKRARKAERSQGRGGARHRELESRREALRALAERLAAGDPDERWRSEAKRLGVTLPPDPGATTAPSPEDRIPSSLRPRRYPLPGGWEALVGKSNRGNDVLTHEIARPGDTWLHADQVSGSHVVLRHSEKGKEPPHEVLLAAAALAAWHSKARHAGKVPVTVTEKRHVRRPRGGAPGQALVGGKHRTIMVKPGEPD